MSKKILISNLKKRYGKHEVLKGVNLTFETGKIYGLIGNNGVGKTTTMSILTGMIEADEGSVEGLTTMQIGYLPEAPAFYDYMTMREYLKHISGLSGVSLKEVSHWIEVFQLKGALNRKIQVFSRGMRQKLGIVACLMLNPDFIILDEPTSALDPEGRHQVLEVAKSLKMQNKTVLLSSHILNDVENVCDEIALMHNGEIVLTGAPKDISSKYSTERWIIQAENKDAVYCNSYLTAQATIRSYMEDGLQLTKFEKVTPSLDEVFRKVVDDYEAT